MEKETQRTIERYNKSNRKGVRKIYNFHHVESKIIGCFFVIFIDEN